jgi:hypothetical protein
MYPTPIDIRSKRPQNAWFIGTLLALDPGETTGWSLWTSTQEHIILLDSGQLKTWPMDAATDGLWKLLIDHQPNFITYEAYNVYSWKRDQHVGSDVPTIQVIGCIQTLARMRSIPMNTRNAQTAKTFVTDDKLRAWGFYSRGQRHSRDSMRHGLYYIMFGHKDDKET